MNCSPSTDNTEENDTKCIKLTSKKTKRQNSLTNSNKSKNKIKEYYSLVEKKSFHHITKSIFYVFNSLNNILHLIYSNKSISIICYNLIKNSKISELKKAHIKSISSLKHYLDKLNKRDLIISISSQEKSLKIWNLYNFSCIYNIKSKNI